MLYLHMIAKYCVSMKLNWMFTAQMKSMEKPKILIPMKS